MYKNKKGFTKYKIGEGDLEVTVYLPPEGKVENVLEGGKLEEREVHFRSVDPLEQYWERPLPPEDYEKKRRAELRRIALDPDYYDPELESYRQREWDRRLNGFWFMNKGEAVYITGAHYFYLTHWKLDNGYPKFRKTDKEWWYFIKMVEEDPHCKGMVEMTKRRQGKCLSPSTLVRMYEGSLKAVRDIKDGDLVMGDDSKPRLVYGKTSGTEEMFKVVPNKGEGFECNRSHILHCVLTKSRGSRDNKEYYHEYVNMSVDEYLKQTPNMQKRLKMRRTGFELPDQQHLVDPYFLGVWLGDGSKKDITITNIDQEIIDYLYEYAAIHGVSVNKYGDIHYTLGKNKRRKIKGTYKGEYLEFESKRDFMRHFGHVPTCPFVNGKGQSLKVWKEGDWTTELESNPLRDEFTRLNLLNNKHIPDEYKYDSQENRLKLLAGLIDTDGTLLRQKNGNPVSFRIVQEDEQLSRQILELAQSCSLAAYFKTRHNPHVNKDYYEISIYGDLHRIPTKIKRKQAERVEKKYDPLITGFTVESLGEGEYQGFAVDDNHLFLLADGTVVHNTMRAGCWIFEGTTRRENCYSGIQSKNDNDAFKTVFRKAIVMPSTKLLDFWMPEYDLAKGTKPKKEFQFTESSRRGKLSEDEEILIKRWGRENPLDSWIEARSSSEEAFDGEKLHYYVSDECFAKNTMVRMFDGSIKAVQDISEGDVVMGDDSSPRNVLSCHSGIDNMYHIIPNKGLPFTVNSQHKIAVNYRNRDKTYDLRHYRPEEYLALSDSEKSKCTIIRSGWELSESEHTLDPYFLGLWLGDGSSFSANITNIDEEVIDYIEEFAEENNWQIRKDDITYNIHNSGGRYKDSLRRKLKNLNLLKNKHIPEEYIKDSIKNRLELLAGLIDTDGSLNRRSTQYEIIQKNEYLADQIVELARSVGLHATARLKQINGEYYKRIFIYGDLWRVPCKVERKQEKFNHNGRSMRSGFNIISAGVDGYYGFTLDGNQHFLLADGTIQKNCGKPVKNGEVDVYDRHDIVTPCLEDDEGYIIGKALYTTTFDDKEAIKGVKTKKVIKRGFKELWENSDQRKRDANGETKSGLYRYYTPAHKCRRFDKYGENFEEEAYEYYMNKRESLADDPTGLQAHIRKFSLNWKEALRAINDECIYNEGILNNRIEILEFKQMSERGNLIWKGGERFSEVEWVKNPNGRFVLSIPIELIPNCNVVKRKGKQFFPVNATSGLIGCDPYNKDRVRWGIGSLGSGAAYLKYGPSEFEDTFILTYAARPEMAKIFFEDMVKMCWLTSMPIFIENNKEGIITYFEDEGMDAFIMRWDGSKGIASTQKNVVRLVEETEAHIEEHGHRERNIEVLEEWRDFSVDERTRFDLGMATGWALVGANNVKRKVKRLASKGRVSRNRFVKTYKLKNRHAKVR